VIDLAPELAPLLAPLLAEQRRQAALLERIAAALPSTWISLREAAERLGCDPRTVTSMAARGEIVTRRAGRRVLVDASSLRPADPAAVAALAREARR